MWFMYLWLPAIAQALIYGPYLDEHVPSAVSIVAFMMPFHIPFILHFCNAPLFSFDVHHRIWLGGMLWFAILTLGAEALLVWGSRLPPDHVHPWMLRVGLHCGWYGFVQLARSYRRFHPMAEGGIGPRG
jgi:hypothetical protein